MYVTLLQIFDGDFDAVSTCYCLYYVNYSSVKFEDFDICKSAQVNFARYDNSFDWLLKTTDFHRRVHVIYILYTLESEYVSFAEALFIYLLNHVI